MNATARRTWVLWLLGLIALGGLAYSAAGWAMAGSLAAAAPDRPDHRHAAVAYLVSGGVSAAVLLAAGVALARRARRRSNVDSPAV